MLLLLLSLDNCNAPQNSEILFTQQLPFSQPGRQTVIAISRSCPAHYPLLIMVSRSRSCRLRLCLCLCLSPSSIRIRSHHRVLVMSHYTIASCLGPTAADAVGISAIFVACATFIQAAKLSSGY